MRMAGVSTVRAPELGAAARPEPLAWARARVTATVSPARGRRSNHARRSRKAATGPKMEIAGARMPACAAASAMVPSVATTTR